jgi:hypothetical protein
MPNGYLNTLPKFNGDNSILVEDHMIAFQHYTYDFVVEKNDVFNKMFVHSLEGEARKWFRNLLDSSIITWTNFHYKFVNRWVVKKDN